MSRLVRVGQDAYPAKKTLRDWIYEARLAGSPLFSPLRAALRPTEVRIRLNRDRILRELELSRRQLRPNTMIPLMEINQIINPHRPKDRRHAPR